MLRRSVADDNSRLVYSTGDEVPDLKRSQKPQARASGAAAVAPGVRLWLERRASSRVVTAVRGLKLKTAELQALTQTLKTACGTGGTLKDGTIELQGDHRAKVEAELQKRGIGSKRAGG
jgi:translation initiation factor 1